MNNGHKILRPIPERQMAPAAQIALRAHRAATRKKRAELRRLNLPVIIWKGGKVRAVPA